MDNNCPCCAPPFTYQTGAFKKFIYVGQFQVASPHTNRILKYDLSGAPIGGTFWTNAYAGTGLRDIAVDPTTGNLYLAVYTRVVCVSSTGVELWSEINNLVGAETRAIAVNKFGHVYAGGSATTITQRNASDGTLNWTYSLAGTPGMFVTGICCDQVGNVYAVGGRVGGGAGFHLLSLDSSGTFRWSATLNYSTSTNKISINAAGTQLIVNNLDYEYTVDASNGSLSFVTTGDVGSGAAHNNNDNYYTGTVTKLRQNGSIIYTKPSAQTSRSVTCDHYTDNAYVSQDRPTTAPNHTIFAVDGTGTLLWGVDTGSTFNVHVVEYGRGRVGAFGKGR